MSVFIARFSMDSVPGQRIVPADFLNNLPFKPIDHNYVEVKNGELICFNYGVALERKIVNNKDSYLLVQGAGDLDLETRVHDSFFNKLPLSINRFPEPFCALMLSENNLTFSTSFCGVDPIFYLLDGRTIYVSNRHNLLGRFILTKSFEKKSFIWIVGRNHISDTDTYWRDLKKVEPSNTYFFDGDLTSFSAENYFALNLSRHDVVDKIEDFANSFNKSIAISPVKKRLWLSGGKDSRAILGLISKDNLSNFDFVTHGESYSPDVMSSKDVSNFLGVSNQHVINNVNIGEGAIDIYKRLAVDLAWCFSGNSFADLKMFYNNKNLLVVGGHENGFKSKSNKLDLKEYVNSRKYWVDSFGILTKEYYVHQYEYYKKTLYDVLQYYPKSRFSQAESVHFRNSTYLASALSSCHLGTSEIHPFLDGRMYELLVGVDDQILESQFIHYVMTTKQNTDLAGISYANDKWPTDLRDWIGTQNYDRVSSKRPYEFKKYFPSQKGFGLHGWRLQLVSLSKNFVINYYTDNASFFDFIDFGRLHELSEKTIDSFVLKDIYFWLSLLKAALIHYFDKKILSFDSVEDVALEIKNVLNYQGNAFFKGTASEDVINILKLKNKALEDCVANQEHLIRYFEEGENDALSSKVDVKMLAVLSANELETRLLANFYKKLEGEMVLDSIDANYVGNVIFSCKLITQSGQQNKALIFFKCEKGVVKSDSLIWSDAGFYYKYLETRNFYNEIKIAVHLSSSAEKIIIGVRPWYSDATIFLKDTILVS
ncbi:hypothetical protein [Rheinheimera mangrovi]|uniref:hypothetical protein n=1 Tax=Rheinheimera mangrovi TaxID=2498451 RepID=UPI000F8EF15C|nr:hypothetical protein [Rheinheimera mangrovi]